MINDLVRKYIPGSEWLYYKIYIGRINSDLFLINHLNSIVLSLFSACLIDKWFYIRYADPEYHLRIRFRLCNINNISDVLCIINKELEPLIFNYTIHSVVLDTYDRELERYGESLIEESESFFYLDSNYVLNILKIIGLDENKRWRIAFKLTDTLLNAFKYDIHEKKCFMELLSVNYKKEFGFDEYNCKQLNRKFRSLRNEIEDILNNNMSDDYVKGVDAILQNRSADLSCFVDSIKGKEYLNPKPSNILNSLLGNYLHMMMNRLFSSRNRLYELLIYDYLKRYYISILSRS